VSLATAAAPKICPSCGARHTTDALFCPNDGTPLTSLQQAESSAETDPYLGRDIGGHIEIRQLAGVGAMGRVYRAFQKGIDRDVAVKILHRELSANQQLVARFHREAKVASRLQHPNVVQVHLAGQLPDGALYIVMEYLDGLSLQSALAAAGGAMSLPRALHIGLQICDAVGEAHVQGIVHRDLKPENVMLVRRGEDVDYVKVLDFGIARLNWGEQSMATAAGLIFGTARYISPEGAQGEAVGPAGDVYAIATLLYQMLAGRTPFDGEQAVALLVQQIHDKPPPLKSITRASYLPDPLAELVMKNLAKDPAARAGDARTLGRQVLEAARASGLSVEDLVPRSILLGAKPSTMDLAPIQRTKQLSLGSFGSELERRIEEARASGAEGVSPRTLAIAPPTKRADGPYPASPQGGPRWDAGGSGSQDAGEGAPAAAATRKWVPPAELQAKLAGNGAPPVTSSGVDPTLDDDDGTPAPPPPVQGDGPPRARTEFATPSPLALMAPTAAGPPTLESPIRITPAPRPTRPSASDSGAASRGETAPVEEDMEPAPRRWRSKAAIVLSCFLLGVVITSAVLYRMGRIGPLSSIGTVDDYVSRANDAMRQQRWDAPPGDNVRDITTEALGKWPREPRLLDIRVRATDELVKEAVGRNFAGDPAAALHLARLAKELDPTDTTAQHLVEQYEQAARPPGSAELGQPGVDAGLAAHGPTPGHNPGAGTPRATLDISVPKPRVGQPVTFVAKVATKGHPDDPHFRLTGPGLVDDTRLTALSDAPGLFQTSFTFFEAGKYEVGFTVKMDGVTVKATRTVAVDDGAATAPTQPPPTPDGGKWL
jgi:serine/threonine-protein kinase